MTEQKILFETLLPCLRRLGYNVIRPDQIVGAGSQRTRTDAIVYDNQDRPAILVEIEQDIAGLADRPSQYHPIVQQAYRSALVTEAPYFLVSDGVHFLWFQINLSLGVPEQVETPPRPVGGLSRPVEFQGAEEFEQVLSSIARYIRSGALPGVTAEQEVLKLFQAKVCDELEVQQGQRRQFYADLEEDAEQVVNRLQAIYDQWSSGGMLSKNVSDEMWAALVALLQPFSLLHTEIRFLNPALDGMISSSLRSERGQFVTPSNLVSFMVDLVTPKPGERVLDPACGTGGFLTASLAAMLSAGASASATVGVYGVDLDPFMAQMARLKVAVSSGHRGHIFVANSLDQEALDALGLQRESFDLILTNPPMGNIPVDDPALLQRYEIAHPCESGRILKQVPAEGLFLEQCVQLLKPGGRMATVVPEGLLSSPSRRFLREWLMQNTRIDAVISLPVNTFAPYTGVQTSVLVLSKTMASAESPVFMASVENVGYDRRGSASDKNDLPEILEEYQQYRLTHSEFVKDTAWTVLLTPALVDRLDVNVHRPDYRQLLEKLGRFSVPVVRLKEIAQVVSRGPRVHFVETGVPIVSSSRQMGDGRLDLTGARHAPVSLAETKLKQFMLQPGDLVISSRGQVGESAVVTRQDLPVMAGDSTIFVRLISGTVSAHFLQLLFSSDWMKRQIDALVRGSPVPSLYVEDVKKLLIPMPDGSIQEKLSSKLQEADRLREKAHALELEVQADLLGYLEDAMGNAK